jgi:hypothetical protein
MLLILEFNALTANKHRMRQHEFDVAGEKVTNEMIANDTFLCRRFRRRLLAEVVC